MNAMNYIGQVRVRSLEELNSNQNLVIGSQEFKSKMNDIEKDSECANMLTGVQLSQFKENPDRFTKELQDDPPVLQTETNCVSPILEIFNSNSKNETNSPVYNLIQSKEELSGKSCLLEIDPAQLDNVCLDLEKEQSQNSQTLSTTLKAFSDNFNIEYLPEQVCPVLLEGNNATDDVKIEPPDDSFCLMEFVETVFGLGCNGENLNCLCAPIRLEIEEEKSPENFEVSRGHDYLIEFESPEFKNGDNISLNNEGIAIQSETTKYKIDENTYSTPLPQIKGPLLDSESANTYKPTIKSPDKVSLSQFVSPYHKVIAGTNFAVDYFRYRTIEDVTAIFLTHYHSDQYHNLKRNLSKPIYVSRTTAIILRELKSSNESMLNVMDLNNTIMVDGVKVTALDANYCPGAIMLLFQLSSGLRVLYTGDFRASLEMELNPFLKAGNIDLLYLDMAYISKKNNLSLRKVSCQSQEKSISDALILIRKFKEAHMDKRILFVFGHHVLGNEELWLQIADTFDFKVWTDEFRVKILSAIGNEDYIQRLVPNLKQADMHLIQHANISHHCINEYWKYKKEMTRREMLAGVIRKTALNVNGHSD